MWWLVSSPPWSQIEGRQPAAGRGNRLAIGEYAQVEGAVEIELAAPVELDGMSKEDVLELRRASVAHHRLLLAQPYEPAGAVYGAISSGAPWWGIQGQFFHGPGESSIVGPAEESRFILNPYLLVGADVLGLSIWRCGHLEWDRTRITEDDLARPGFPFVCQPDRLVWHPADRWAEVSYDVSSYIAAASAWAVEPLHLEHSHFDLIAYNARDLGLGYLAVAATRSRHIYRHGEWSAPTAIPQFLHRGGSCGYPGGCNNMSPDVPAIQSFDIEDLPASAVVRLWSARPASVETTPEMTFVIRFR